MLSAFPVTLNVSDGIIFIRMIEYAALFLCNGHANGEFARSIGLSGTANLPVTSTR
ncbi:MAG: hypothetical protein ACJ70Q_05360 [Nitrososphaera sp.]